MMEIRQDADAILDYVVGWADWLGDGETLTAATFTATDGITIATRSFTNATATVRVSGGTVTNRYKITNHITTNTGEEEDHSFTVIVVQR